MFVFVALLSRWNLYALAWLQYTCPDARTPVRIEGVIVMRRAEMQPVQEMVCSRLYRCSVWRELDPSAHCAIVLVPIARRDAFVAD